MERFDLKPCPFCDGRAVPVMRSGVKGATPVTSTKFFRGYVKCTGCGATCAQQKSPEAMVQAWNRRHAA